MHLSETSRARHRARASLAIVASSLILAVVFAAPSIGGSALLIQASPTGSATPSTSASPTASASPSPSSSEPPAPRAVSLITSKGNVTWGNRIRLSGRVVSTDPECEAQEAVVIHRRFLGASRFRVYVTPHTDSEGRFATRIEPRRSAEYRARLSRHEECAGAASEAVTVSVRVVVRVSVSDNPIAQGNFFTISGEVKPRHAGSKVFLDRKGIGGWNRVDASTLNRRSDYSFTLVAGWEGERTFRVRWRSQDRDHESNKSRVVIINSV